MAGETRSVSRLAQVARLVIGAAAFVVLAPAVLVVMQLHRAVKDRYVE